MNIKIKLCGLRDKESILASSGANYIGFVFYQKSPRFINALEAKKLRHYINANQKLVGLFVDADLNLIDHISEIPLDIQSKILRVLIDQKFKRINGSSDIKVT